MWNFLFVFRNGIREDKPARWNLVRVFLKGSIVEIPKNETDEGKLAKRGTNWNSTVLVLSEGQMRIRVVNIDELCHIIAEIEADGKRDDVLRDDIGVYFIF
jgi:hypothetical protein